jgi:hypothetical protein
LDVCFFCANYELIFIQVIQLSCHPTSALLQCETKQASSSANSSFPEKTPVAADTSGSVSIKEGVDVEIEGAAPCLVPQQFQQLEQSDSNDVSCFAMVELDMESAIDDVVLTGATTSDQLTNAAVHDQFSDIKTLDQLISEAVARDQLLAESVDSPSSSTSLRIIDSKEQLNNTKNYVKLGQRGQLKAKFDRRRRAALQANGRVISAVVAELHSMVSSGSAILDGSDDRTIEQLRKVDRRPPRQQLP